MTDICCQVLLEGQRDSDACHRPKRSYIVEACNLFTEHIEVDRPVFVIFVSGLCLGNERQTLEQRAAKRNVLRVGPRRCMQFYHYSIQEAEMIVCSVLLAVLPVSLLGQQLSTDEFLVECIYRYTRNMFSDTRSVEQLFNCVDEEGIVYGYYMRIWSGWVQHIVGHER